MGVHIAASKCSGVIESVPATLRVITGNTVNVLAIWAFYVAFKMGIDIVDAYLGNNLEDRYEWWPNFYEFHKLTCNELESFNYAEFKENSFEVKKRGDYPLALKDSPNTI